MQPLKILYGVQATGNGHISRARVLAPKFKAAGADVTCLFSGRKPDEFFNMETLAPYLIKQGITFEVEKGKISWPKTMQNFHGRTFIHDLHALQKNEINEGDIIISDFEPLTARAARHNHREAIGVGNQFAYMHENVPRVSDIMLKKEAISAFCPVTTTLGVHWHHYNHAILPPITKTPETKPADPEKIVIYMNFENPQDLVDLVNPFTEYRFYIYSSKITASSETENVALRPVGASFREDLADCAGVMCNAGFELPTEVLSMGRKLLVKPLDGQAEQETNTMVLHDLGYADTMEKLDREAIRQWLEKDTCVQITYPDVAQAIADWLLAGHRINPQPLADELWHQTRILKDCPVPRL
jgi:uncharacterized protein (TIGR00661 family)